MEPGQNPSGQNSSGWHRDPMGRFEYRYFNGVQWTSDVSVNGQRYVDAPISQILQQGQPPHRPRGMAITSFVTAISALAIGWVPFVFAFATCAAIVAIPFGFLGLKTARQHEGSGRRFAVAGLVLAPIALAVCVGGFFFTRAVLNALHEFVDAGPHELTVEQPCTGSEGLWTFNGTIRNTDDHAHDYRIVVDFDGIDGQTDSETVSVNDVEPGETADWSSTVLFDESSVDCKVSDVLGPSLFDIQLQS